MMYVQTASSTYDQPEYTSSHLEYMLMNSMLAHALNQQEMVNWVAVPALKIKGENFLSFTSMNNSCGPVNTLNYQMTKCHYSAFHLL